MDTEEKINSLNTKHEIFLEKRDKVIIAINDLTRFLSHEQAVIADEAIIGYLVTEVASNAAAIVITDTMLNDLQKITELWYSQCKARKTYYKDFKTDEVM